MILYKLSPARPPSTFTSCLNTSTFRPRPPYFPFFSVPRVPSAFTCSLSLAAPLTLRCHLHASRTHSTLRRSSHYHTNLSSFIEIIIIPRQMTRPVCRHKCIHFHHTIHQPWSLPFMVTFPSATLPAWPRDPLVPPWRSRLTLGICKGPSLTLWGQTSGCIKPIYSCWIEGLKGKSMFAAQYHRIWRT